MRSLRVRQAGQPDRPTGTATETATEKQVTEPQIAANQEFLFHNNISSVTFSERNMMRSVTPLEPAPKTQKTTSWRLNDYSQ